MNLVCGIETTDNFLSFGAGFFFFFTANKVIARIFNIYFTYEDELYSAIVSVRSTPLSKEYILGNLDADLRTLLPGTCIVSESAGKMEIQNIVASSHSPSLMKAILKSLASHADNRCFIPLAITSNIFERL